MKVNELPYISQNENINVTTTLIITVFCIFAPDPSSHRNFISYQSAM